MVLSVTLLVVLSGVASSAGATIPLAEYRERLRRAALALDALAVPSEEAEEAHAGEAQNGFRTAAEAHTLREVRRILPPTERIEWAGGALMVDNRWLHEALDNYERTPFASEAERTLARQGLTERVQALAERLPEASRAGGGVTATGRDKEEEKGRLAAILRRPEYNEKKSQGGALARLFDQFVKWLRDLFPQMKPLAPGTSLGISTAAQIFILGLALAVIAFVIWKYLWPRLTGRVSWRRIVPRREARVVLGERLAPDQTAVDLLAEAESLARSGDTRAAIRKAYIALLCELGDRKIIRLAQHKTNRDYLRDVHQRPSLYAEIEPLTASFEKHWYGSVDATAGDWMDFRARSRVALDAV